MELLVCFVLTVQLNSVLGLVRCRRFINAIKTADLLAVAGETEFKQSLFRNLPTDFCHQNSNLVAEHSHCFICIGRLDKV
jgi:hypothetical protein